MMNTRHEADQLSVKHYDRKWREIIKQMPQGGDYCFYMRQYGYDIIKNIIRATDRVFDYACGLGVLTAQLHEEKRAYVYGCDISKVAINYVKGQIYDGHEHPDQFQVTDKIFADPVDGEGYHYIIATYFLEHVKDPVSWLNNALEYAGAVIASIPNNFKRAGEHVNMQWGSWDEFYALFNLFKLTRLDEGKYHPWLPAAYHHPTFKIEKK